MPVAVAPDDPLAAGVPDPSVVAGYADCLKEALKFLLERERLPPQHPVVAGLALHLARPSARSGLRRASHDAVAKHRLRNEQQSLVDRGLHQVKHTVPIGKARTSSRFRPLLPNSVAGSTHDADTDASQSQRDVNGELRRNLQQIVENLEYAINDTQDDDDSDCYFSDEDESISEVTEPDDHPNYDVDENDLDAEIDTILGDAVLRRELVRLVYQGCDLVAAAPVQAAAAILPASPASPQLGATADPEAQPIPNPLHI
ncbi:uncharacterized protein LOC108682556 [Hyalella azteca]|uniref:Uncharacterized protein LOC108682556 n=1 Tax=Hyalella azteca TaxID=294128 RepID=A0A8B7PML5_HYAAZ|nr:uncharacterized protein LOC108682556 [Hyalella azteca]